MNSYVFRYRKKYLWSKIKNVSGHKLEGDTMVLYLSNGGIRTIREWSKYEVNLGADWVLYTKNNMEKESGVNLKLAVQEPDSR